MRPIVRTVTGAGVSAPLFPNTYVYPNMSIGVECTGGNVTVTVEHTYDDLLTINAATGLPFVTPATAQWIANTSLNGVPITPTTPNDSNYQYVPRAIRLRTTGPSVGTVVTTMTVVQSGGGTGGG